MPELPEVETTIKGLKVTQGKKISKILIHTKKLRFKIPNDLKNILLNSKISKIKRIAKYIIIDLDNSYSLIIHLGMSGRLKIKNLNYKIINHDHFVILLNNRMAIIYNDPRKFGFVDIIKTDKLRNIKYISSLGIDALSKRMNYNYLYNRINKSEVPIKQILLNQKIIAGIGNIYASEILFDCGISPLIHGKDLKISDIIKLIASIRNILKKAIKSGGSSIRDYKSTDGTLGNFQTNFKVYGKEGEKVGNKNIVKIVQYGRSTFYCPGIQK